MSEQEQAERSVERAPTDESGANPYSYGRLFGVAVFGAVSSLVAYAVYNSLDPSYRASLRESVLDLVKSQTRALISEG